MANIDKDNLNDVNRQIRIQELKNRAEELSGPCKSRESEELPPEIQEAFWKYVVSFEQAPHTTFYRELVDSGLELSDPDTMNDLELKNKLWEVIYSLADKKTFLQSTDHLGDRELYSVLCSDVLHHDTVLFEDELTCTRIDLIGSGGEEDTFFWLKYYADEETRSWWKEEFPEYEMPAHEDLPCRRDHMLPR